jgi:nucleotide-binding universal stress UspA family protein
MNSPARAVSGVSVKNILFATDFSTASLQALPYATMVTSRFKSKLYVAHIVPPEDYASGAKSIDEAARLACKKAQVKLSALGSSEILSSIPHATAVDHGDVWVGLSDFIQRFRIELLVIGTKGRSGVKKFLLGSVAEEVMRESPCPVLTVGPKTGKREHQDFRKIVYATDFSAESLGTLSLARSFAEKFDAQLILVHALEGLPESPYLDAQMARVRLQELVPQAPMAPKTKFVVTMGAPADVILRAALDSRSDLIVIGARGAGAIARLASHFGSVAHKVVSRAACPVLTVRLSTGRKQQS